MALLVSGLNQLRINGAPVKQRHVLVWSTWGSYGDRFIAPYVISHAQIACFSSSHKFLL